MRKTITLVILVLGSIAMNGQQTLVKTLMHDGLERSYIIYIPDSYSEDDEVPLLFNFHGYTGNAEQQMTYGDFRPVADEAGFILVHPEGSLLNGITHWNVGGWTIGSTADDVGFTEAMIEDISMNYNIDQKRIYSTGLSNGGFMSYLLACQLGDKIAAIASVAGSMTPEIYTQCDPQHPTPVLYIHGTSDDVVSYNGAFWSKKVTEVVDYWRSFNECETEPIIDFLPDNNLTDGSTVERISYLNGTSGSEMIHYKINGGGHTWPGTSFAFPGTNLDFKASEKIWEFLSRFDIDGVIDIETSMDNELLDTEDLSIFPNPVTSTLNIVLRENPNFKYELRDLHGRLITNGELSNTEVSIDMSKLSTGFYFLLIGDKKFKIAKTN